MSKIKELAEDLMLSTRPVFLLFGGAALFAFVWVSSTAFTRLQEPDNINVAKHYQDSQGLVGYTTAATIEEMIHTLNNKPLGYVSNDILPPFIFLDDIQNWEQGAIKQLNNIALAMFTEFSRAGAQSNDDPDLNATQNLLRNETTKWIATDYQKKLSKAEKAMHSYKTRLMDDNPRDGQFVSKSTSLVFWLKLVDKNLGDLATSLGASRGEVQVNTALAGDTGKVAWKDSYEYVAETPWLKIDDVYWESRGQVWALLAVFKAIRADFDVTLDKKSAGPIVDQIIRALTYALRPIDSPYIFNGSKDSYGYTPNYSQQLSSDITRADNGVRELITLLENG